MAFGRKNEDASETTSPDYVTRGEAQSALSAYITKEDAEGVVRDVAHLRGRVDALETLANVLRAERASTTEQPARFDERDEVRLPTRTPGAALGVDYGAIAFGLSEIKRNVARALTVQGGAELAQQYEGTVQYFADVFSKSDPSFDEVLFKRQSGV